MRALSLYIDENVHFGRGVRNGRVVVLLRANLLDETYIVLTFSLSGEFSLPTVYLVESRVKSDAVSAEDWRFNHPKRLSVASCLSVMGDFDSVVPSPQSCLALSSLGCGFGASLSEVDCKRQKRCVHNDGVYLIHFSVVIIADSGH